VTLDRPVVVAGEQIAERTPAKSIEPTSPAVLDGIVKHVAALA